MALLRLDQSTAANVTAVNEAASPSAVQAAVVSGIVTTTQAVSLSHTYLGSGIVPA